MTFTVIDAPQRSEAWYAARAGRLTGSVVSEALAKLKDGKPAASRRNLALRLMLERVTGKPQRSNFVSEAMQDGIDREADARRAYEVLIGEVVQESGFLAHNTLMVGCSLDGHMGHFQKLMSIKCRQPAAHLEFLRTNQIPADALAQMTIEAWITGCKEHDYFSWNPDFPADCQSRLVTVKRAEMQIALFEAEVLRFLDEVQTEMDLFQSLRKGWAA